MMITQNITLLTKSLFDIIIVMMTTTMGAVVRGIETSTRTFVDNCSNIDGMCNIRRLVFISSDIPDAHVLMSSTNKYTHAIVYDMRMDFQTFQTMVHNESKKYQFDRGELENISYIFHGKKQQESGLDNSVTIFGQTISLDASVEQDSNTLQKVMVHIEYTSGMLKQTRKKRIDLLCYGLGDTNMFKKLRNKVNTDLNTVLAISDYLTTNLTLDVDWGSEPAYQNTNIKSLYFDDYIGSFKIMIDNVLENVTGSDNEQDDNA